MLFLQAPLVSGGRTDLHRKTGMFGVLLGSLVIVVGVMVVLGRVAMGIAEGHLEKAQQFMLIPLILFLNEIPECRYFPPELAIQVIKEFKEVIFKPWRAIYEIIGR